MKLICKDLFIYWEGCVTEGDIVHFWFTPQTVAKVGDGSSPGRSQELPRGAPWGLRPSPTAFPGVCAGAEGNAVGQGLELTFSSNWCPIWDVGVLIGATTAIL